MRLLQVALTRFIDDTSVVAIEDCLIDKLPDLFTPAVVLELGEEQITALVSESEKTAHKRESIGEKHQTLKNGLRDIKRLQRRRQGGSGSLQKPSHIPYRTFTPNLWPVESLRSYSPETPSTTDEGSSDT